MPPCPVTARGHLPKARAALNIAAIQFALLLAAFAVPAAAEEFPRGQVIDDVKCAADASQSYALYLPSHFTPDRPWSLLMGFHPGARGKAIVETFQSGAEKFGYIVAASNNSRNGSWKVSEDAVAAITVDLGARFPIDRKRIYTTGLSGGARVALQVALVTGKVAGVIASSAGYPDSEPRKSVPFAIFGTAGIEDFNYLELRRLDLALTTAHRVVIFDGGHQLPPTELATEALEWMELQAMKSGRRERDEALIDASLARRNAAAVTYEDFEQLAADFSGLRDVTALAARAAGLKNPKAIKKDRAALDLEERQLMEMQRLLSESRDPARRAESQLALRDMRADLTRQANAAENSSERQRARRLLRSLAMNEREGPR